MVSRPRVEEVAARASVLMTLYLLVKSGEPGVKVLRAALAAAEDVARRKQRQQLVNHLAAYVQQRFHTEWWATARRSADTARRIGETSFVALCPDGVARDLLDDDREVPL